MTCAHLSEHPAYWGACLLAFVLGGFVAFILAGLMHSAPRDDRP